MTNNWFIIQTNPNNERKAVGELRRIGIRVYLPKFASTRWSHRQKKMILVRNPAIVGYIFVRFPKGPNWYALRRCQGVKGILYSDGRPFELPRNEVAVMMRAQRRMAFDTPKGRDERMARDAERRGQKNALVKARFPPGSRVRHALNRVIAEVKRVTERGTVIAVAEVLGAEREIEFTETEVLETEREFE